MNLSSKYKWVFGQQNVINTNFGSISTYLLMLCRAEDCSSRMVCVGSTTCSRGARKKKRRKGRKDTRRIPKRRNTGKRSRRTCRSKVYNWNTTSRYNVTLSVKNWKSSCKVFYCLLSIMEALNNSTWWGTIIKVMVIVPNKRFRP